MLNNGTFMMSGEDDQVMHSLPNRCIWTVAVTVKL